MPATLRATGPEGTSQKLVELSAAFSTSGFIILNAPWLFLLGISGCMLAVKLRKYPAPGIVVFALIGAGLACFAVDVRSEALPEFLLKLSALIATGCCMVEYQRIVRCGLVALACGSFVTANSMLVFDVFARTFVDFEQPSPEWTAVTKKKAAEESSSLLVDSWISRYTFDYNFEPRMLDWQFAPVRPRNTKTRLNGDAWWIAQGRIGNSVDGIAVEKYPLAIYGYRINSIDRNRFRNYLVSSAGMLTPSAK